jgi:uncharacterized protein
MSDQFSEGVPPGDSAQRRSHAFSEGVPSRSEPLLPTSSDTHDDDHRELGSLRVTTEERILATFAHGAGVVSWIIAPLIFYLMQANRRSLAGWHAREAFNFQLSTTIYYLLPLPLFGLVFIDLSLLLVALAVYLVVTFMVAIFALIVVVLASVAAYRGQYFRCPLNIPFIPRPQLSFDTDDHADLD